MKKEISLKELQSQLVKRKAEAQALQFEIAQKQKELSLKEKNIKTLFEKIESLNSNSTKLKVSEHSLLRYLERVKGLDLKAVEQEMLNDQRLIQATSVLGGNGTFPFDGKYQYVIRNNVIVTVKDPNNNSKNSD
jgi:hypothetical protein